MLNNSLVIRFLCLITALSLFGLKGNAQTYEDVALQSGIQHFTVVGTVIGGGTAIFDYNNDGFQDIFLIGGERPDKLFQNDGDGTFTDVSLAAGIVKDSGLATQGVVTGDIDNDGDRDLFVTTMWGSANGSFKPFPCILYENNGDGTFTDISASAGILDSSWSVSASMGDYNKDGLLDIYVVNYVEMTHFINDSVGNTVGFNHDCFPNFFYINQGNNTFVESAATMGMDDVGCGLAVAWTDFDNDNDVDLFVVNDFGEWVVPNRLFRNNYPTNSFTEISDTVGANAGIYGMGIAIGDYDEDQDLDYYFSNLGRNVFYDQTDTGFVDVTDFTGTTNTTVDSPFLATSWGNAFIDYDNNTWLDLYVNNGYIPAADLIATDPDDPNKLYRNNMDGTFTDVSDAEGVSDHRVGRGSAYGDYDHDGDIDIVSVLVDNDTINSGLTKIYRNRQNTGNNWLNVRLEGTVSNRDAFGTRLRIVAGGRTFIREIDGGSSHASHNSSIAHFGLGNFNKVDSLIITWPNSAEEIVTDLNPNQHLYFIEGGTHYTVVYNNIQDCDVSQLTLFYDTIAVANALDTIQIDITLPKQSISVTVKDTICSGDSIFIAGAYRKLGGTYTETIISPSGCDTLLSTQLTVLSPAVFSNESICDGDSIFLFGQYRYTVGTYFNTVPNPSGCDTTFIVNLKVKPTFETTINISICDDDSVFVLGEWRDMTVTLRDTLQSVLSCDSVIVYEIVSGSKIIFTKANTSICQGDSFFVGGAYQDTGGTYFDTIISALSCDTIIITPLTVVPPDTTLKKFSICPGDSVFAGGAFQQTTGDYVDVLQANDGCDSIVLTNVVVATSIDTFDITICEGDSIFANGTYQKFSGVFVDVFTNQFNCDSTIVIDLTVVPFVNNLVDVDLCFGDSVFVSGAFYGSDTVIVQTLTDINGCDSLTTTTIDVYDEDKNIFQVAICEGDSVFAANAWQTTSGSYGDTAISGVGCDSIIITELAVLPNSQITFPLTITQGDSILVGGAYQTTPGTYGDTFVSNNGCDSVVVTLLSVFVGVETVSDLESINLYPNPNEGVFTLDHDALNPIARVEVFDLQGRLIHVENINSGLHTFDLRHLTDGVYLLKVNAEQAVYHRKVVIAR